MKKEEVIQKLVSTQKRVISDLETSYNRLKADADIDENETRDPEDFSRQTESGEMARRFKFKILKAQNDLEYLEKLEVHTGNEIAEGSLVVTDSLIFFVGISIQPIDQEGRHIVSISTKSPIYTTMRGLKAGDNFAYANRSYHIDSVS